MHRFKPQVATLIALAAFFTVTSSASAAGTHAIHCKGVTVSSGVLELGGVLSNSEDLEGALRVKATRTGRKPYFLPRGDLVSEASIVHRIGPGHVVITNPESPLPFDKKKGKGRWRVIPVAVKDVHFAGEYKGRLELGSGGCKVDFSVLVAGAAEINLVGIGEKKAVKLKFARCRYLTCGPDDFLAWLNSPSSRRDEVDVQVDNASQAPAEVTAVQVAMSSETGEESIPESAFAPPDQAFTLPPQHAEALPPIGVVRGDIAPGHYTGAIYLTVAGAEARIALPFELDLKDGPFWALVVLFASYFVHMCIAFVKYARSRNSASNQVGKVRRKAKVQLGDDAVLVAGQLDRASALARGGHLSEAESEIARIDEEIGRVEIAQGLETAAMSDQGDLPDDVAQTMGAFQAAVREGEDSKQILEGLKEEVESAPKKKSRLATAIIAFGVYVLPWLVRVVLVVAFLFAGLEKLYFSNATFGAQEIVDYGGLFLWGLSAAALDIVVAKFTPDPGKA